MEGGGLGFSRRGMSPLIATVLLMAFAVALGGMIMNWKVEFTGNSECQDLSTEISVTQFCTEGSSILLRATSSDNAPHLQGVRLSVVTGALENSVNVRNSELSPGEEIRLSIPIAVEGAAEVELLGMVGPKGKPYVCSENPIERVNPIQPC